MMAQLVEVALGFQERLWHQHHYLYFATCTAVAIHNVVDEVKQVTSPQSVCACMPILSLGQAAAIKALRSTSFFLYNCLGLSCQVLSNFLTLTNPIIKSACSVTLESFSSQGESLSPQDGMTGESFHPLTLVIQDKINVS